MLFSATILEIHPNLVGVLAVPFCSDALSTAPVRRRAFVAVGLAVATSMASPAVAIDAPPVPETVTIEVPAVGDFAAVSMIAEVFRPEGAGPFPVVIFSHGRSAQRKDREALKVPVLRGHVGWWMRRGFAVVAPVRPGYGATGGPDREASGFRVGKDGACAGTPRLEAAGRAAATAVRAAVDWTRAQNWASKNALILEGQSVGGFASIVAGGDALPGVVGVIDFSGGASGFPDIRPGASCAEGPLTEVFRRAGRTTRVPSLWIYSQNDRFWGADAPRRWHAAFAEGGSRTEFVMTDPVDDGEGHHLLARGGKMWGPVLDRFVTGLGFPRR